MRKILAVLLSVVLAVSVLLVPAGAAVDANRFWQENGDKLMQQNIFQYGERPFREGLMPALVNDQWNYINEKGEVVDLNRDRFMYVFDFFEGLAAVMDKDTMKVGYIDTTGKLVIPCQFYAFDSMGSIYVGYFHNGKATVFTDGKFTPTEYGGSTVKGAQIAEINKSGSKSNARTWDSDDLTGLYLIGDNGYMPDAEEIPMVTYGQASAHITGYTIDEDYVGKMVIEVTNTGNTQPDKGDLFYIPYAKFSEGSEIIDAGVYVPYQYILQISYEVEANATTTLKIPVGFLPNYDQDLTEGQIAHGWQADKNIESARTILAQAETPEEAAELRTFFMGAHDYGEMGLTYEPDSDGVTILAAPMPTSRRAQYLDQKLSAFTSQF